MRALFFGTADGFTSAGRDHTGILLQLPGTSLLLDCGAAAGRGLVREKMAPDVPGLLWLSHMHSDHIGQFGALIQSLWLRERRAPLHAFGPAEVLRAAEDWLGKCLLFTGLIGFPIEWHPVRPGEPVRHGALTLTAFATAHLDSLAARFRRDYPGTCFECYGLTLDHEGGRFVYSADLDKPSDLDAALKGGKVATLVCEITHFPERALFRYLAAFSIQSLWLTHYPDHLAGRENELKVMAREEHFAGTVHVVQDNVAHEL